jgi:hypothetical protein
MFHFQTVFYLYPQPTIDVIPKSKPGFSDLVFPNSSCSEEDKACSEKS